MNSFSRAQVLPEKIPYHEGYRLRFCPPSARTLKPELVPPQASELPPGAMCCKG